MITYLLSILAGAGAAEPAAQPETPKVELICRYDPPISALFARRKMCLTAAEWEARRRNGEAALHPMLRDTLGDVRCEDKGICTGF